jgi:hypothetical protein
LIFSGRMQRVRPGNGGKHIGDPFKESRSGCMW